ncbi:hypothetical protein KBD34_05655 [Patescibacteria group bacterium]|nr:hypothetical protein [Patescibacteria group bacterium]
MNLFQRLCVLSLVVFLAGLPLASLRAATVPSCRHPYYPLRAGYQIDYRHPNQTVLPNVFGTSIEIKAVEISDDTEALRVTKIEKGLARLTSIAKWKERTRNEQGEFVTTAKEERLDQTIYCKSEGLQGLGDINMTPEKMASLAVAKDASDFLQECGRLKVTSYSGVYLPKLLTAKSEWKNTFQITRAMQPTDVNGCTFDLTTSSTYKALGAHKIKVAKKTYIGIAVAVTTELRGTSSRYGTIEKTFEPRVAYWVKGLGLVQISNPDASIRMSTDRVKP